MSVSGAVRVAMMAAVMAGAALSALAGQASAQSRSFVAVSGDAPSPWELEERKQIPDADAFRLLRRAAPIGDLQTSIANDDPIKSLPRTGEEPGDYVGLFLVVGADGRVSHCEVSDTTFPTEPRGVCDRVSDRIRFIPGLDRNGARTADFYDLNIQVSAEDIPPPPLLMVRSVGYGPLRNFSPTVIAGGFDDLISSPLSPEVFGRPNATVEVRTDARGALTCAPRAGGGDTAFIERACATALRGRFDFSGSNKGKSAYLYVFERAGQLAVLLPIFGAEQVGGADPATVSLLRSDLPREAAARLRLELHIDTDGRVVSCAITTSTGDDGQDFNACDRLLRQGRFAVTTDPFGRPAFKQHINWVIPD